MHDQQSTATREALMPMRTAMSAIGEEPEARSLRRAATSPLRRRRSVAHAPPKGPGPELPGNTPVETPQTTPDESPFESPEEHPDSVPPQSPPNPPPEMPELPRSGRTEFQGERTTLHRRHETSTQQEYLREPKCFQYARMMLPSRNSPSTNTPIPVYPGSASSTMHWRGNAGSMRLAIRGCAWHTSARRAA